MSDPVEHKGVHAALVAAYAEMPTIRRETVNNNPRFRSWYTSLGVLINETKKVLSKHGLAVVQPCADAPAGHVGVQTIIVHKSGETFDCGVIQVPTHQILKNNVIGPTTAHTVGSAVTYARRYSLAAAMCISDQEDDDGNGVSLEHESDSADPQPPQRRDVAEVPDMRRQAWDSMVRVSGFEEHADRVQFSKQVLRRLGIDPQEATDDDYRRVIAELDKHASHVFDWLGETQETAA